VDPTETTRLRTGERRPRDPLDLTEEKLQELIEDLNTDLRTEYSSRPTDGWGRHVMGGAAIYLAPRAAGAGVVDIRPSFLTVPHPPANCSPTYGARGV
jgi:hypothetical protein